MLAALSDAPVGALLSQLWDKGKFAFDMGRWTWQRARPNRSVGNSRAPRPREVHSVTTAELGKKRTCPGCGGRFYDLNKSPAECPYCETVFNPEEPVRAKRTKVATPAPEAPKKPAKKAESEDEDDLIVVDDDANDADADDDDVDGDIMEDTSDLGEDDDDVAEVLDNVERKGDE